jgi:hypothetical protein
VSILGYALRRTTSPDDAADILAETFLTAWRRLDELPSGEEAGLWLYGVARRGVRGEVFRFHDHLPGIPCRSDKPGETGTGPLPVARRGSGPETLYGVRATVEPSSVSSRWYPGAPGIRTKSPDICL